MLGNPVGSTRETRVARSVCSSLLLVWWCRVDRSSKYGSSWLFGALVFHGDGSFRVVCRELGAPINRLDLVWAQAVGEHAVRRHHFEVQREILRCGSEWDFRTRSAVADDDH